MQNYDKYDLISCRVCGKRFNDFDQVCTISSRRFYDALKSFEQSYVYEQTSSVFDTIPISREINFHEGCFLEIAGTLYMP